MTTHTHVTPETFGLTELETDVLLGLCIEAYGAFLPVTPDGRLARDAFGKDLALKVVGQGACGVQFRHQIGNGIATDGAPDACVYRALVLMGLAFDSLERCAWAPTPMGYAVASAA